MIRWLRNPAKDTSLKPPMYNHMVDVAFTVETEHEMFENIPVEELIEGLMGRALFLKRHPEEAADAFGPVDSYECEDNPRGRPTPFDRYKIPFTNIAEASWGRGGTSSHKTTRPGFRYFSCSGHGGYVVDGRRLTPEEKAELDAHDFEPDILHVLVQSVPAGKMGSTPHFEDYVIGARRSSRRPIWYDVTKGKVEWRGIPVYLFEEDCDWALVEKVTGVRLKETPSSLELPPSEREKYNRAVEETYERWHASRRRKPVALELDDDGFVSENPCKCIYS